MYPLHDKDLDRLSRNAAGHYEMDFGPSGWEQLEKRLDQELPQDKGKRRRFLFWLFFIVVTTGSALTGLLINSQPVTPLASRSIRAMAPVQESPAVKSQATTSAGTSKATNDPVKTTTETTMADDNDNKPATEQNKIENNKTPLRAEKIDNNKAPMQADPVQSTRDKAILTKPVRAAKDRRQVQADDVLLVQKPVSVKSKNGKTRITATMPPVANKKQREKKPAAVDQNDSSDNEPVTTAIAPSTEHTATGAADKSAITPAPDSTKAPAIAAKPKKPAKQKTPSKHGFEFGVVAGPDGTTVGSGPFYRTGYNVGLQIGYRINDRWSLNTGVIYTKKRYEADSNSFNPKDPWFRYYNILDLTGSCQMFDIPVNVRYDVSFNDKKRLFISTGLSTYIMDKQDYWYRFNSRNNPTPYPKDTVYTENEKYPFSVLNLSLGYERMLGKHFSIQAEPYIKLPLKGLGYGDMRMNSYGMFLSLKYRPGKVLHK